jgi:glycerol uptake facilitator-like aquaporin
VITNGAVTNPSISIGLFLSGFSSFSVTIARIFAQLASAIFAHKFLIHIFPTYIPQPIFYDHPINAIFIEAILTGALMLGVLYTSSFKSNTFKRMTMAVVVRLLMSIHPQQHRGNNVEEYINTAHTL